MILRTHLTQDNSLKYTGFDISMMQRGQDTCIAISQQQDLEQYLEDIEVQECNHVANPMISKYDILKHPWPLDDDRAARYKSVAGALNFYSCGTRYDVSYAVSRLSQYMANPTVGAELAMQRVLSYLKSNPSLALVANLSMQDH